MNIIDDITALVTAYDATMTDAQLRLYIEALSDIEPDALHLGIVEIIKTSKWMPKVSEIREAVSAAQARQETQLVMDWHDSRNIGDWRVMSPFDFEGGVKKPFSVVLVTCETCGVQHAWESCPDCEAVKL